MSEKVLHREVVLVEILDVRAVKLILTQVHKYLFTSIEVDAHAVRDVLYQVCEGVAPILLIVHIRHHLMRIEGLRFHISYVLHEILQSHAAQLSRHYVGSLPRAYILELFLVVEMEDVA